LINAIPEIAAGFSIASKQASAAAKREDREQREKEMSSPCAGAAATDWRSGRKFSL